MFVGGVLQVRSPLTRQDFVIAHGQFFCFEALKSCMFHINTSRLGWGLGG